MAAKQQEAELWIDFASDAIARYEIPDEVEDVDDLVDDMIQVVTKYADSMLDEFNERFAKSGKKRRNRKKKEEDEEEEEEEDED